jgi:hypothetical protein
METCKQAVGTYALEYDGSVYAAFDPELIFSFLGLKTEPKFYEDKYPFFDDKNLLVDELTDKREVWFNGKKISFFLQDFSALRFQAVLASNTNETISIIASETSKLLLPLEELSYLIAALDERKDIQQEEAAWYEKNGPDWESIVLEAYDKLKIKHERA